VGAPIIIFSHHLALPEYLRTLKEARLARDKAQALLIDGIDPTEYKNHEKNNFKQKYLLISGFSGGLLLT